jgi:succinyl-CoA synthetase alpha subunit
MIIRLDSAGKFNVSGLQPQPGCDVRITATVTATVTEIVRQRGVTVAVNFVITLIIQWRCSISALTSR